MAVEAETSYNLLSGRWSLGKVVGREAVLGQVQSSRTRIVVTKEERPCPLSLLSDD